jgi:hypothetical protein
MRRHAGGAFTVAEGGGPSYLKALGDLLATGATVYPAAINAAVTYWSEMASQTSRYCADLSQTMIAAAQHPRQSGAIVRDLAVLFKKYLERSGDLTERSIIEFNQRLEGAGRDVERPGPPPGGASAEPLADTLRRVAALATTEAWRVHEGREADLRKFRGDLEGLLGQLPGPESVPGPERSPR